MNETSWTTRTRARGLAVFVVALAALPAGKTWAQEPPPRTGFGSARVANALGSGGDHPLTTAEAFDGNVDVAVEAVALNAVTTASGSFSLAGLPAGATIRRAWLIVTDWSTSAVTGTFGGSALPAPSGTATDGGLSEERYDVTAGVTGNGSYAYSVSGLSQCYGLALVVVYEHPSLPLRHVVVNDGAEDLTNATSTTSFSGFAQPGPGRLIVFTQADNTGGSDDQGEALAFNAATLLGPGAVYSANLGLYASLLAIPVNVVPGTNTAAVTTGTDEFGLHLAVLVGPPGEPIPILSPWALLAFATLLALIGALAIRRL